MTNRTYRTFPQTKTESLHVRAIARNLGAQPVDNDQCADFLIMHQNKDEPAIPANFLRFFQGTAHGGRKVVVIPDADLTVNNPSPDQDSDWLLVLNSGKATARLEPFLNRNDQGELSQKKASSNFDLEKVKKLVEICLGGQLCDIWSALKGPLKKHFPKISDKFESELVEPKGLPEFYYAVAKLLFRVNANRHDLSKIEDSFFNQIASEATQSDDTQSADDRQLSPLQTLGAKHATKYFLEVAQGLLESLQQSPLENRSILVIDDDVTADGRLGYGEELIAVINLFLPDSNVSVWNPQQQRAICDKILEYQTITQSRLDLDEFKINVRPLSEDGSCGEFEELCPWGFEIFLVDQLFKPERRISVTPEFRADLSVSFGDGEFLGARLIKGLRRMLTDRSQLGGKESDFIPMVAISRTDDPSLVLEAYRAGAAEYLPKRQLTRLPALLGNLESRGQSKRSSLHRNFHALHRLPNECIGLMQKARIPRIPFHAQASEKDKKACVEFRKKHLQNWSRLLELLPKADLHVHAGSTMSREFLLLASLVMLVRHPWEGRTATGNRNSKKKKTPVLSSELAPLVRLFNGVLGSNPPTDIKITFRNPDAFAGNDHVLFSVDGNPACDNVSGKDWSGKDWIDGWGKSGKCWIKKLLSAPTTPGTELRSLRASLHRGLKIPDHIDTPRACAALDRMDNIKVALHLIRNACKIGWSLSDRSQVEFHLDLRAWKNEDLIRAYLLVLGSRYEGAQLSIDNFDFLTELFSSEHSEHQTPNAGIYWNKIHGIFYQAPESRSPQMGVWTPSKFIERGWSWPTDMPEEGSSPGLKLSLPFKPMRPDENQPVEFDEDPIGYTLATGTRSRNLIEYLRGCEFSGAEHLRHPFLVHVYACQTIMEWVRRGVFYAELRASPGGYINEEIDFDFSAVTRCLIRAFSDVQAEVLRTFQGNNESLKTWLGDLLGERYSIDTLRKLIDIGDGDSSGLVGATDSNDATDNPTSKQMRLPVKASLIFVGKRHKSMRDMILEAAGAAALLPGGERPAPAALNFIGQEFSRCRVVGFDLAGPEEGNPPAKHAPEFGRLNRLHLPITVHAGENAGAQFIEDSILELGARRIGHGLSLAEDDRLVARVRDDNVVIELCPVCNHQTSQFHGPDESPVDARKYPLKKFLKSGVLVTINTDNPIISDTNMVREFYQASYAYDDEGLTLWDALRIIRMGIVSSFLNMRERHHLLEIAEQRIFDYFSEERTLRLLRQLASQP